MIFYNIKIKAFTLVELIIVIVILAILATIAFINFSGYGDQARDTKIKSNFSNLQKAMDLYFANNGIYPDNEEISGETYFSEISKNQVGNIHGDLKNGLKYYNYELSDDKQEYRIFTKLSTGEIYEIKSKNFNSYLCSKKYGFGFYYSRDLKGKEICEKIYKKNVSNNGVTYSIIPNTKDRNYGYFIDYYYNNIKIENVFNERTGLKKNFKIDNGFFRNLDSTLYGRFNNIGVRDSGTQLSKKYLGFYISLNLEKQGDYVFLIGGDDSAKLTINGESFDFSIGHNIFPIHLKSGNNSIELKYRDIFGGKQGVMGELVGPFPDGTLIQNGTTISPNDFEKFLYSNGLVSFTLERTAKIVNAPKKWIENIVWNTNDVLNNPNIVITGEDFGYYCEDSDFHLAYIGESNSIYQKPNFCVKYERYDF